jgi:hypothetical protein
MNRHQHASVHSRNFCFAGSQLGFDALMSNKTPKGRAPILRNVDGLQIGHVQRIVVPRCSLTAVTHSGPWRAFP